MTEERRPSVIFFFESIPFQPEEDVFGPIEISTDTPNVAEQIVPLLPNLDDLADLYLPVLQAVLNSPLNASGMVQAVFINFGSRGIYEIRPQADFIRNSTPRAFEFVLDELFRTGGLSILRTADRTVEYVMLVVPDFQTIVARIQEDYVKIGCFSGAVDGTNLHEYLSATSNHQSFFFVLGNFAGKEIDHHIEAYVKVSEINLNPNVELSVVLNALEVKWGVV